jgi:hypothetical protein
VCARWSSAPELLALEGVPSCDFYAATSQRWSTARVAGRGSRRLSTSTRCLTFSVLGRFVRDNLRAEISNMHAQFYSLILGTSTCLFQADVPKRRGSSWVNSG